MFRLVFTQALAHNAAPVSLLIPNSSTNGSVDANVCAYDGAAHLVFADFGNSVDGWDVPLTANTAPSVEIGLITGEVSVGGITFDASGNAFLSGLSPEIGGEPCCAGNCSVVGVAMQPFTGQSSFTFPDNGGGLGQHAIGP